MKQSIYKRAGFTMLELIFVIVILGIVASIGSQVIARTYEAYINQKALYKASIKTELVATQIANRLAYAIPGSIVRRSIDGATLIDIANPDNDTPVLQWIGYDRDGFTTMSAANRTPGWSGFVDLTTSARAVAVANINLSTPGSTPALSNTIIATLSARGANVVGLNNAAIYFPNSIIHDNATTYNPAGANNIYAINGFANNQLTIAAPNPSSTIQEQYKLAWTSYAIVPSNQRANGNFDLNLRYNFQPWNNQTFFQNATQRILLRNVSVFRFTGSLNSVRFKLCVQEQTGGTAAAPVMTSICKEKVVIR